MCEKNFDGKVMSLLPPDEDDINEETIVDDEINDDSLITDDTDNIIVGASKRKKRYKKKKKICKGCGQDTISLKKRGSLRYNNRNDRELVKEYCKDHEMSYGNHKCKPHWCGDCEHLIKYNVEIDFDKADYYSN
jgi:hypothetical protein